MAWWTYTIATAGGAAIAGFIEPPPQIVAQLIAFVPEDLLPFAWMACVCAVCVLVIFLLNLLTRKPATACMEFITDIEGNWEYFNAFVARSSVLSWNGNQLMLKDNNYLVVGGDGVDKGTGDIRVTKALSDLKKRKPNDVVFILGNRDVNKLRFSSELARNRSGNDVNVYWDPKHTKYHDYLSKHGLHDNPLSTLKWMLDCTMGSNTTFQTRRMELAAISNCSVHDISEEMVFNSFKDSVDPSGQDPWMLHFIEQGDLAEQIGDCLFIHGGINAQCIGTVPPNHSPPEKPLLVKEWAIALNAWAHMQMGDFRAAPVYEKGKRGAEGLMDYGLPGGNRGATVVYASWLENGNCKDLDPKVEEWLLASGVKRVFTGHQPHGECPSVIRSPRGVQIFMCDTSYSQVDAPKDHNPANNRGDAVSVVSITRDATRVSGVLADGVEHGYVIKSDNTETDLADWLVGRKLQDNSWVKTVIRGNGKSPHVVVAKGEGFKLSTKILTPEEAQQQLHPDYQY